MATFKQRKKLQLDNFRNHDLYPGRLISKSKNEYLKKHPGHQVFFNANVFGANSGKIWYGDLDINIDASILQSIAEELNETLYILPEHLGRFGSERKSLEKIQKDAVWHTT